MEIYGMLLSPYVARVVVAARAKGIKHKVVMPKDMKSPAYRKMSPFGKMPALKDGAVKLFESSVIVEYLEAKSKKNRLLPSNAKAAAKVRLAAAVFGEYVNAPTLQLFNHMNPAKRDQAVVDAKLAEISRGLSAAEGLIGKPYAAGKFSLAECYAIPTMFFLENMLPAFGVDKPLADYPKLIAYRARLAKDKLASTLLAEMAEALKGFLASQQAAQGH
jgi:glutathione S-transferase